MKFKYEYFNDEDRQSIIVKNSDKYIIEEQNITEGNFLIFTDVKPIEIEVKELKVDINEIALTSAFMLEDSMTIAEMVGMALSEIEKLKTEIATLKEDK